MVRKTELLEAEGRLQDLIFEKHAETRGWTRVQTDRIAEINERLDALCHYLGIKMERHDKAYWDIKGLEGKDDA